MAPAVHSGDPSSAEVGRAADPPQPGSPSMSSPATAAAAVRLRLGLTRRDHNSGPSAEYVELYPAQSYRTSGRERRRVTQVALVQLKGHTRESDQIPMAHLFASRTGSPRTPPNPRTLAIRRRVFYGFVVFTYVGTWLLISAGLHTRSLGQPISGGVRTSGVVVSERVTHEDGYTYRPVILFRDTLGRQLPAEGL